MTKHGRHPRPRTRHQDPKPERRAPERFSRLVPHLAAILTITFVAFSPALSNQLVQWDDYIYIVDNPVIHDLGLANLLHIFDPRTFVLDNYHPLTILSYAIEYHLVGVDPFLYHLDNILLHLSNVALAAGLAWLLTRSVTPTLVAAALFAVHPMRVESVVWAAERKDLLYAFFFLLSLIAYVLYAGDRRHPRRYYAAALVCLLLSSLAKAQGVMLSATLFLVDAWFGRRDLKRLIFEKLPFLVLSLVLGYWATVAQQTAFTPERLGRYAILDRFAIGNYDLIAYLFKLVAPYRLSAFYGYPRDLAFVRWAAVLVLCLAVLFYVYGRRSRVAVFGVLFYLSTIVVVIQLVPIGDAILADRFTYVPYLGLFLWVGHLVERAASGPRRALVWLLVVGQLIVFAGKSFAQARTWQDTESLWRQVLRIDPHEPRAYINLGAIYLKRGERERAIWHMEQGVANGAGYDKIQAALRNLGAAYSYAGRHRDAARAYERAIEAAPQDPVSWRDRGLAHARAGEHDKALADYSKALELDPKDAEAFYARGNSMRKLGRPEEAIADYSRAIALRPDLAGAYSNRANGFADMGELGRAIEDYDTAVRLAPTEGINYLNRSRAHFRLGELEKAWADYEDAVRRGRADPSFLETLRRAREERRSRR